MAHRIFTLVFSPHFVRAVKKLPPQLQEEVFERVELFKNEEHHRALKTHALVGRMKSLHAFSVNYRTRVAVRIHKEVCEVYVLDVGDHSVYE